MLVFVILKCRVEWAVIGTQQNELKIYERSVTTQHKVQKLFLFGAQTKRMNMALCIIDPIYKFKLEFNNTANSMVSVLSSLLFSLYFYLNENSQKPYIKIIILI